MVAATRYPSPLAGEGGARCRRQWEGEGIERLQLFATQMRRQPTEAEKRLWSLLRDRRLAAYKFRRQVVLEPYIADFVCFDRRVIVETDGSQHIDSDYDARRDAWLRSQGFAVIRYWNNDVLARSRQVAEALYAALLDPSPSHRFAAGPSLSRKGRGAWST